MPETSLTALGFDYGTHWIGTAIGQTRTGTASPLQAVRVINNKPDWHSIGKLIETWQPSRLIVGLPMGMDGVPHQLTRLSQKFSRQLEGRFHIKTELSDERLTTREAWQIVENESHRHISKPEIDCIAAVLITETWLSQASTRPSDPFDKGNEK